MDFKFSFMGREEEEGNGDDESGSVSEFGKCAADSVAEIENPCAGLLNLSVEHRVISFGDKVIAKLFDKDETSEYDLIPGRYEGVWY